MLRGVHEAHNNNRNEVYCKHFLLIYFYSQLEYDAGFMYDVSLQIESEFNGETKSIVPEEHKKQRHK